MIKRNAYNLGREFDGMQVKKNMHNYVKENGNGEIQSLLYPLIFLFFKSGLFSEMHKRFYN